MSRDGDRQGGEGWFDYHLWEFAIAKRRDGLPMDEDWGIEPRTDASKVRLREVLRPRKTTIDYLYVFDDCWEHGLTLTNIRAGDPDLSYPRYIAGERNAPPEDCGGIPGFYETLNAAAADPKHPNHVEAVEWLDDYDPDTLDELPIKCALGRIANQRNAVKVRLAKKKRRLQANQRNEPRGLRRMVTSICRSMYVPGPPASPIMASSDRSGRLLVLNCVL